MRSHDEGQGHCLAITGLPVCRGLAEAPKPRRTCAHCQRAEIGREGRIFKRRAICRPFVGAFRTVTARCIIFSSFCCGQAHCGLNRHGSRTGRAMRCSVFVTTMRTSSSSSHFSGRLCSRSTTFGRRPAYYWSKPEAGDYQPTIRGRQRVAAALIFRCLGGLFPYCLPRSPRGPCELIREVVQDL